MTAAEPLRLVVLGDSTAFTNEAGPQLPWDPTLYPTLLAEQLGSAIGRPVHPVVIARPGMTVREMHRTVTKDRHVQFEVLFGADAVVVGVGSFDHAPGGVPPSLEAVVPFLRPAGLRRRTRAALGALYPVLVRASRGRLRRTPPGEFERLYDGLLVQVRGLTRGAAGVVLGPTSHRSAYYGGRHPRHAEAQAQQFAIAERHGYPCVASWPHVEAHLDDLNPDGIHWPRATHVDVAAALTPVLADQLLGRRATPGVPWAEEAADSG